LEIAGADEAVVTGPHHDDVVSLAQGCLPRKKRWR
jgi:hypothetical protein